MHWPFKAVLPLKKHALAETTIGMSRSQVNMDNQAWTRKLPAGVALAILVDLGKSQVDFWPKRIPNYPQHFWEAAMRPHGYFPNFGLKQKWELELSSELSLVTLSYIYRLLHNTCEYSF